MGRFEKEKSNREGIIFKDFKKPNRLNIKARKPDHNQSVAIASCICLDIKGITPFWGGQSKPTN